MRILVIEYDLKVANFIATGLGQEGYAVDVLHEGTEAGEQALACDYDAVVLDLMLPGAEEAVQTCAFSPKRRPSP